MSERKTVREWHTDFAVWLGQQLGREDAVGDLARDAFSDRCWTHHESLGDHMQEEHNAIKPAVDAYLRALLEFRDERRG